MHTHIGLGLQMKVELKAEISAVSKKMETIFLFFGNAKSIKSSIISLRDILSNELQLLPISHYILHIPPILLHQL